MVENETCNLSWMWYQDWLQWKMYSGWSKAAWIPYHHVMCWKHWQPLRPLDVFARVFTLYNHAGTDQKIEKIPFGNFINEFLNLSRLFPLLTFKICWYFGLYYNQSSWRKPVGQNGEEVQLCDDQIKWNNTDTGK